MKNLFIDTGGVAVISGVLYCLLHRNISLDYRQDMWFPMLCGYLFLNMLLYFTLYFQNYKKILQDVSGEGTTLANCYVLKVAVVFIALSLLSANGKLLKEQFDALEPYKRIEQSYQDYVFLDLDGTQLPYQEEFDFTQMLPGEKIMMDKFVACYQKSQTAIATPFAIFEDRYFYVTQKAAALVNGLDLLKYVDPEYDLLVFVPDGYEEGEEQIKANASGAVKYLLGLKNSPSCKVIRYTGEAELIYFDHDHIHSQESRLMEYCLEENPIIVYENSFFTDIFADSSATFSGTHLFHDVMFLLEERELQEVEADPVFIVESVVEQCQAYANVVKRVILLTAVLSICVILLDIFLISAISRMEYQIGAKQYSVKKVLGYSSWQRYRMNYLLNLMTEGIAVLIVLMASAAYVAYDLRYVFLAALFLLLLSSLAVNWNMIRLERENIVKILKGGSL